MKSSLMGILKAFIFVSTYHMHSDTHSSHYAYGYVLMKMKAFNILMREDFIVFINYSMPYHGMNDLIVSNSSNCFPLAPLLSCSLYPH